MLERGGGAGTMGLEEVIFFLGFSFWCFLSISAPADNICQG
jgi:hypothetical protein